MTAVYIIGSLRDPRVPDVAVQLREAGYDAFDGWFSAGPDADDRWRDHERFKGNSYTYALDGYAARNVFAFDRFHLHRCHAAVLVLPAGRSCHLEAGSTAASKPVFALLPEGTEPERWDVMTQFLDGVHANISGLLAALEDVPDLRHVAIAHDQAAWLAGVIDCADLLHVGVTKLLLECGRETAQRIIALVGIGSVVQDCYVCANAAALPELLRVLWPYLGQRLRAHLLGSYADWLAVDPSVKDPKTRAWWTRALHFYG